MQLTAGSAYPLSRACSISLRRLSPVTTPGGTRSLRDMVLIRVEVDGLKKEESLQIIFYYVNNEGEGNKDINT